MNYWLLTTEFPPIHGGGISTYCWHTCKMLVQNNVAVKVFVNDYQVNEVKREKPFEGVEVIRFNPANIDVGSCLGPDARLSLQFAHIVEEEIIAGDKPDVLETQDYLGIGYYTLQKKHLLYQNFRNLKTVLTIHAPSFLYLDYNQVPMYQFPTYWTGEMEKASIMMADLVISPSNYIVDELTTRMNIGSKNPVRIFNPYINERNDDAIVEVEQNDMVFFGKLTPQKGALEMLAYLATMWDNGFDKSLRIVGGGAHFFYPMQEDMQSFIEKKYVNYIKQGLITFEGNVAPKNLKSILAKAHVVIIPSIVDNLPYAAIEAMAMGKVLLSSENSGHTELIDNHINGFVFSHTQPTSFVKQLEHIYNLPQQEFNNIGKKAQESVEKYTNYHTVWNQKKYLLDELNSSAKSSKQFPFIEDIAQQDVLVNEDSVAGLLSIVIPFYNLGNYIQDTIDCLQQISYTSTEVIIVDDGSSDKKSINMLEEIKQNFPVKIIKQNNHGLSAARNAGAKHSKGEFLAFLDADDMVKPTYYQRAIEVLNTYNNVSFVGCWAQYFGASTDTWPTFNPEPPYLLCHNMINSSALVYKRNHFLQFGLNDSKMIYGMEDYESVIAMVKNGARGVAFPELWWQYRIRKDSMAQAFNKNKELYLYRLISKKHTDFYNKYGSAVANILNHNGSGIKYNNPTWPISNSRSILKWINFNGKMISLIKKNKHLRTIAKGIYRVLNHSQ